MSPNSGADGSGEARFSSGTGCLCFSGTGCGFFSSGVGVTFLVVVVEDELFCEEEDGVCDDGFG